MHVLVIAAHYTPDLGPSAPLYCLLCKGLVQLGHQVTVIAMVPHYPTGYVQNGFKRKWFQRSIEDGVEVIRVLIPSLDRKSLINRMIQLTCFQIGAILTSFRLKFDAAIMSNPFLCSLLPILWHTAIRKKPTIYSVHDVYPDVGIKLGIFRSNPVVAIAAALERFCLEQSCIVRILSDSFRPGIKALGVTDSKISLIYDWVDTDLVHPLPRDNSFARENGLSQYFVVLYAGNIGLSQGLENVLAAAERLADHKDIRFVFIGDGASRLILQDQAQECRLENVLFLPFQPRSRLPEVLAAADVSLVSLRHGIGFDSLPSKIYSIFASGRPVLASLDENCEAWKLINQAQAGICIPPEDPKRLADTIILLKKDHNLREKLGCSGRKWAEQYHSPQSAAGQFEQLLFSAITK